MTPEPSLCASATLSPAPETGEATLIVTGNSNVGKSVMFQLLTGRYATVSNYPGTTVMVTSGRASLEGQTVRVLDTPGLNSLLAASEDELVARDILLTTPATVLLVGEEAVVAFVHSKRPSYLQRLGAFGLVPGQLLRLKQTQPALVIQLGETSLALDHEAGREIFVKRRVSAPSSHA